MRQQKARIFIVLAVAFLVAACSGNRRGWAVSPTQATAVVEIDPGRTVTAPFMGLGVQWDRFYYTPAPADLQSIKARMDFCQPGYLRVMLNAGDYCLGFAADGRPKYIWTDGDAGQRKDFEALMDILGYAQSRGIAVILGEWGPPKGLLPEGTDPRWPRLIADFVTYVRNVRGDKAVRYCNLINEPNGDWSGNKDYATWLTVVRSLHREFRARGLSKSVRLIGPDTTGNTQWMEPFGWLDKVAKDAPDAIGAYDLHWYAMDSEVLDGSLERVLTDKRQVIEKTDPRGVAKPRFLGESGLITGRVNGDQQPRVRTFEYGVLVADYVAQAARAGWQGALAWDMDDAMHLVGWDRRPEPPDALTLKVWGFWNSQGRRMGHPEEMKPRPWFYTWSLMSRLFPRGSRIVSANGSVLAHFRALAATHQTGKRTDLSVMLVNDDAAGRTVTVRLPRGLSPKTLTCYHDFDGDSPTDSRDLPRPAAVLRGVDLRYGLQVTLPTRGVLFLTTQQASGAD